MQIQLTHLTLREARIPFRFSFNHALAKRAEAHSLILEVRSSTGHAGYGEVVPRSYLTGESIESAWEDIRRRWWPAARALALDSDRPPFAALRPLYLEADAGRKTASYAGLDVAIFDALARATRQPIPMPGPGRAGRAAASLTVPIGQSDLVRACAAAAVMKLAGFREFKLKAGGGGDDIARARAIRRVIGACDLRVDANGAWTVGAAIETARALAGLGISSIEQPVPPGDPGALAEVQREGGLPVMADESLCTLADARALLDAGAASIWNLRLAKIGGFSGMAELLRMARENGIDAQLGVLVGETSILGAAARACAGWADFRHVEFGFPALHLRGDPFAGGPGGYFGTGRIPTQPGLGVRPLQTLLDRFTIRCEAL